MYNTKRLPIHAYIEIVFDICYLLFAVIAGITMICISGNNTSLLLYGTLSLVLGCGDAFHLIPRIFAQITGKMDSFIKLLGIGKLITSITMTVFYILLYFVWMDLYKYPLNTPLSFILMSLAAIRILLCLFPQNKWTSKNAPTTWAIYRNIPFFIIGIITIGLFVYTSWPAMDSFIYMPISILLSFLFYTPVVLFSKNNPKIGALMLPKTMAYVWIICMGFSLI